MSFQNSMHNGKPQLNQNCQKDSGQYGKGKQLKHPSAFPKKLFNPFMQLPQSVNLLTELPLSAGAAIHIQSLKYLIHRLRDFFKAMGIPL